MIEPDPLPGLGHPPEVQGDVERAARRTLAALDAEDLLEERDAVLCQSLLTLAHQYDRAANSTKARDYAIANLHAQLLSTIDQLMPERGGEDDDDDPWTALERDLAAAAIARNATDAGPAD